MPVLISGFCEGDGAGRVARPFGFALTDPGMRLSPHLALPEGNPCHAALIVQGWVIFGLGGGKRSSIALKRSQFGVPVATEPKVRFKA